MRVKIDYYSPENKERSLSYYAGLSEKNQRHFVALEYLRLGPGSQRYFAAVYSCSRTRICRGSKELNSLLAENQTADYTRQRAKGGGVKKKSCK